MVAGDGSPNVRRAAPRGVFSGPRICFLLSPFSERTTHCLPHVPFRPTELRLVADARMRAPCLEERCVVQGCHGSIIELNEDESVTFKASAPAATRRRATPAARLSCATSRERLVTARRPQVAHHKTAGGTGLRVITAPAASATARVWRELVLTGAPYLRARAPAGQQCAAVLLDRNGGLLGGDGTLPSVARRVLVKAGLPDTITSRSVRKATARRPLARAPGPPAQHAQPLCSPPPPPPFRW